MANKSIDELEQLENNMSNSNNQEQNQETVSENRPNSMNGYTYIDKDNMPQQGILYPESWQFAYRCPTAKEIANFSTINEQDQPAVLVAIEDLIRKCVVIYDTENDRQVNTGEICDGHRTWFLMLLRETYLPGNNITVKAMCQTCKEAFDSQLTASKLVYPELREKLINAYDGRCFTLELIPNENPIKFRVPTLETSGRIFKYIVKAYRQSNNQSQKDKQNDVIAYDKQFLLLAPYLFETGHETIREITLKYKKISRDEKLFNAYLTIVNKLHLENEETYYDICPACGSEEEVAITFPGGFKKLFIADTDNTGYFD